MSILLYEIGSRDVKGSRIFLYAEALMVFAYILSIYILSHIITKKKYILTFLITLLLLVSITPNFLTIINYQYGDSFENNPFRNSPVIAYRSDYKTQYLYLSEHYNNEDIWINVMGNSYYYFNKIPDYRLKQNSKWNNKAIIEDEKYIDILGGQIIHTINEIEEIILNNPQKRIWLVANGGSINILYTTHIRNDFINFIKKNKQYIVFNSTDNYTKILLFNDKNETIN